MKNKILHNKNYLNESRIKNAYLEYIKHLKILTSGLDEPAIIAISIVSSVVVIGIIVTIVIVIINKRKREKELKEENKKKLEEEEKKAKEAEMAEISNSKDKTKDKISSKNNKSFENELENDIKNHDVSNLYILEKKDKDILKESIDKKITPKREVIFPKLFDPFSSQKANLIVKEVDDSTVEHDKDIEEKVDIKENHKLYTEKDVEVANAIRGPRRRINNNAAKDSNIAENEQIHPTIEKADKGPGRKRPPPKANNQDKPLTAEEKKMCEFLEKMNKIQDNKLEFQEDLKIKINKNEKSENNIYLNRPFDYVQTEHSDKDKMSPSKDVRDMYYSNDDRSMPNDSFYINPEESFKVDVMPQNSTVNLKNDFKKNNEIKSIELEINNVQNNVNLLSKKFEVDDSDIMSDFDKMTRNNAEFQILKDKVEI